MKCKYCKAEIVNPRWNSEFCRPPAKCKSKWWNEKMMGNLNAPQGYELLPDNDKYVRSLAIPHHVDKSVALNWIVDVARDGGRTTLENIQG